MIRRQARGLVKTHLVLRVVLTSTPMSKIIPYRVLTRSGFLTVVPSLIAVVTLSLTAAELFLMLSVQLVVRCVIPSVQPVVLFQIGPLPVPLK